jgi:hypothetical protein
LKNPIRKREITGSKIVHEQSITPFPERQREEKHDNAQQKRIYPCFKWTWRSEKYKV